MNLGTVLTGAAAGISLGYVLQRSNLCFHSAWGGVYQRRMSLFKAWILGVAIASAGLSVIYSSGYWPALNEGLPFRPVANIVGGLVIGAGMVVASSCVSGLFFKLGSGMLSAGVGVLGWAAGELIARPWQIPGPTLLPGGVDATLPHRLGLARWEVALPVAAVAVIVAFRRGGGGAQLPQRGAVPRWGAVPPWGWRRAGVLLGLATVAAWALAGMGGAAFGPGTVGLASGFADRHPDWWLTAFLGGIVGGAALAARCSAAWRARGERPVRYAQLAGGGVLLGAGGRLAGGCNLGHGLSGVAQLNISSWVVVAATIAGIGLTRSALRLVAPRGRLRPRALVSEVRGLGSPRPFTSEGFGGKGAHVR